MDGFPTEEIFTTAPAQFNYYPAGGDTINGLATMPLKRWTRLTMAYDEALEVYANALPHQDKAIITFDHIDPDLAPAAAGLHRVGETERGGRDAAYLPPQFTQAARRTARRADVEGQPARGANLGAI